MMTIKQRQPKRQDGFTILELMISTVIVAIILLLVTSVMIGLQSLYYKGVNQESVQNNVRAVTNSVSQEIQDATANVGAAVTTVPTTPAFSITVNGTPYSVKATCIGTTRYLYIIGLQVGSGPKQVSQALWQDSYPPGACGAVSPSMNIITGTPTDGGVAYIASGARLTDFEVNPPVAPNTNYAIYMSVAIGADDLLKLNPGPHNDYNAQCITSTGDQFCATASLLTDVGQRVL